MVSTIEVIATVLFAIAIIHTFSVPVFAKLAHKGGPHAGIWHLFAEVEAVFGIWATVLIVLMILTDGFHESIAYLESRNFTEPLFVFVIMVVAASRPIVVLVRNIVKFLAEYLPVRTEVASFFITLSLVPLSGSLITEPAAMTLAAFMLKEGFFARTGNTRFKYLVIGTLFVNISIGGVLTAYAAPPVLMVAGSFGWDTSFMLTHFGWKAVIAILINTSIITFIAKKDIILNSSSSIKNHYRHRILDKEKPLPEIPIPVTIIHVFFLVAVVLASHHIVVFIGLLLLFIGFCDAYSRYQRPLLIREGLMVGFFLAGLIILGGLQKWWLQDVLSALSPSELFWGTTFLTALTDNAALTYLGSLVDGTSDLWRYMLVAGAVTGGGLTVIANAPNPAGFSILRHHFPNNAISPQYLLLAALVPTLIAAGMFLLPF